MSRMEFYSITFCGFGSLFWQANRIPIFVWQHVALWLWCGSQSANLINRCNGVNMHETAINRVTSADSLGLSWLLLWNTSGHYKLCTSECAYLSQHGGEGVNHSSRNFSLQAICLHSWQSSRGPYLPLPDSFHPSVPKPSLYLHLFTSFSQHSPSLFLLRLVSCLQLTSHHQRMYWKEGEIESERGGGRTEMNLEQAEHRWSSVFHTHTHQHSQVLFFLFLKYTLC